jgi:hypothetical protein
LNCSVIVEFNSETVVILNKNGYSMCCFMACESESGGAQFPLCWDVTKFFLESVCVSWYDDLIAYCSTSALADRSLIIIPQPESIPASKFSSVSAVSRRITMNEQMVIGPEGSTTVETGFGSNVAIMNNSSIQYVGGLGVKGGDEVYYGICGINLYGHQSLGIKPLGAVFLVIVPGTFIEPNMSVEILYQIGVLVDVSKSSTKSRSICYDINAGWSPSDNSWIKHYSAPCQLGEILIQKPS